ncbi:MAG TPA: pilus assembly PilX N-terminal domain-containing protein [Gemmatimonadota bacterium]|nr:pilus assembly PilX N-terminal domain-containing protein [Gemmatimonadota bacterium]
MSRRRNDNGIVLPVILVALMIMSALAVAAVLTAGDEQRSSEAMHESSIVFYAAEAGVQEIWGSWDSTMDSLVNLLSPADTLDLGWSNLAGGASYHGMVMRTDDGSGEPTYSLMVEGKGPGARGGRRMLAVALSGAAGGGGSSEPYTLGECCHAAATARGAMLLSGSSFIHGHDEVPPGWDDGRCDDYPLEDVVGLTYTDLSGEAEDPETTGDPPLVYDPSLADADFNQFGELNWDDLAALATTQLYNPAGSQKGLEYGGDPAPSGCSSNPVTSGSSSGCYVGPRYNPDGTCDTSHPLNFGAKTGPCKDHYPVVLITGDFAFAGDGAPGGYAQGIFVMDTTAGAVGSEFDIEKGSDFTVAGIMIGKGCFEMDSPSSGRFTWYGAVFTDGFVSERASCDGDVPLYLHGDTEVQYSSCAVQRALLYSGVGDAARGGASGGSLAPLPSRSMREILR